MCVSVLNTFQQSVETLNLSGYKASHTFNKAQRIELAMTADLSDNLFTQSVNKRVMFAKNQRDKTKLPLLVSGLSGQSQLDC